MALYGCNRKMRDVAVINFFLNFNFFNQIADAASQHNACFGFMGIDILNKTSRFL